jgi:hypothetical protein
LQPFQSGPNLPQTFNQSPFGLMENFMQFNQAHPIQDKFTVGFLSYNWQSEEGPHKH